MSGMEAPQGAAVGAKPPLDLRGVGTDALLKALHERGAFADVSGAAGALYDHLARSGALHSEGDLTAYLAFRLRRDLSKLELLGSQRDNAVAFWKSKVDSLAATTE